MIVTAVTGVTSVAFHLGIARATDVPTGQVANGSGLGVLLLGITLAFGCAGILLAMFRVGRAWAVWLLGSPLAAVYLGLTAFCLGLANAGGHAGRLRIPRFTPFVIGGSLAIALGFGLAALATDSRLPRALRYGVPWAIAGLTGAAWGLTYLIRFRT